MPYPELPPEVALDFDAMAAQSSATPEDAAPLDVAPSRPKAGLWDWLSGAGAPAGRPHFPTLVRIAAMGPAPVTTSGAAGGAQGPLYQVTVEVETEPSQATETIASCPPATHYVLTASVVRAGGDAEGRHETEEFRHHCKSTVPFARCTSFAVTGLYPGTLYEFDVCAANSMGSSEGVQVHVLTPSPSSSTAPAGGVAPAPAAAEGEDDDSEEDAFFDADEQAGDSKSHASNEGRRTLEELLCEEPDGYWEECQDTAAEQARLAPLPMQAARSAERSVDHAGHSEAGTADAAEPQAKMSLFPGFVWASGFQINERQLTLGHEPGDVEKAVERLQATCVSPISIRPQQALRLALGMGLDTSAAEAKWRQILSWRRDFQMEEERARARERHSNRSVPVSFPYHDEVCKKLLMVSPCALVTTSGHPVSVWRIGTLNAETATTVSVEHISTWSRALFEYLDVWLAEESDRSSRLLGHIHVFDLEGLSWWHLMSGELLERGRAALGAGEFYVENCYDVYAINASALFNAVWRLLQRFLSARAAAKIVVDSGVPNELLEALGPMAWERLQGVLQAPLDQVQPPILRPPRRGGRLALL
mmetsp:Transcript_71425/g.209367  ORF Transcript_71425/g.209367 Transcript_71425/m.209367 type:complete len:591 (+) Transcript_71425:32-1804(+)